MNVAVLQEAGCHRYAAYGWDAESVPVNYMSCPGYYYGYYDGGGCYTPIPPFPPPISSLRLSTRITIHGYTTVEKDALKLWMCLPLSQKQQAFKQFLMTRYTEGMMAGKAQC